MLTTPIVQAELAKISSITDIDLGFVLREISDVTAIVTSCKLRGVNTIIQNERLKWATSW